MARFLVAIVDEERLVRFLRSVWDGSGPSGEVRVHPAGANGQTGVVTAGGGPISAHVPDVADGPVKTIRVVTNLEKPAGFRGLEAPR